MRFESLSHRIVPRFILIHYEFIPERWSLLEYYCTRITGKQKQTERLEAFPDVITGSFGHHPLLHLTYH